MIQHSVDLESAQIPADLVLVLLSTPSDGIKLWLRKLGNSIGKSSGSLVVFLEAWNVRNQNDSKSVFGISLLDIFHNTLVGSGFHQVLV